MEQEILQTIAEKVMAHDKEFGEAKVQVNRQQEDQQPGGRG